MKTLLMPALSIMMLGMLVCGTVAQNAYFSYVEEPVQPRSAAMGGSGTAGGTGGFSYYNPAAIATLDRPYVAFEYGQQWSDLTRGAVETAWIFPQWFIGGSFLSQGISFTPVDEFGTILPGEGTAQESQLSLMTGWRNERFALGIAANGLHHHIYDADAYALSASGGISAKLIPGKLLAGAALMQAGRLFRGFNDNKFTTHRDSMPTTARIGASLEDTLFDKLPVTLQVDALYSMNIERVMVPVGIELRPVAPLTIRMGKRFNHPTDLFTCGIGVSWENLSYNIALIPTGLEGDPGLKWTMGLTYALPVKKQKKVPVDSTTIKTVTPDTMQQTEPVPEDTTTASTPLPQDAGETVIPTVETDSSASAPAAPAEDTTTTAQPTDSRKATTPVDSSAVPAPAADAPGKPVSSPPDSSAVPALPSTVQPNVSDTAVAATDSPEPVIDSTATTTAGPATPADTAAAKEQ